MTVIKIPFNDWSIERLQSGTKTATSRNKCYGNPGDVFVVKYTAFEIFKIEYLTLMDVAYNHYKEEGAISSQEFINVWTELHPKKGFVPSQKVYFHTFRKID